MVQLSCCIMIIIISSVNYYCYYSVVPPVLVESVLNLTMTITDNATLICVFEGFPKPLINWYHNGVMISNDSELINETESVNIEGLVTASSYLRLSQISLENEGEYVCVATENIFGNSDFSTGRLTVQGNKNFIKKSIQVY